MQPLNRLKEKFWEQNLYYLVIAVLALLIYLIVGHGFFSTKDSEPSLHKEQRPSHNHSDLQNNGPDSSK